jgi:hypothetical protein
VSLIHIETNLGETFDVPVEGLSAGKPIMAFESGWRAYCLDILESGDEKEWFLRLDQERSPGQSLCDDFAVYESAVYSSEFCNQIEQRLYREDEYHLFFENTGIPVEIISEKNFPDIMQDINERWQPVTLIKAIIDRLLEDFKTVEDTSVWFYHPEHIPDAYQQFSDTLQYAIDRNAETIRIQVAID